MSKGEIAVRQEEAQWGDDAPDRIGRGFACASPETEAFCLRNLCGMRARSFV